MRRLFLDDERMPSQADNDMYVVRSYDDAVAYISSFGCPDFISFDHDLGDKDESKTGYALAKWLVYKDLFARGRFIPEGFTFSVHSQNPVGAKNIEAYLTNYLTQRNTDLSGRL
jgi:hypothetical protein